MDRLIDSWSSPFTSSILWGLCHLTLGSSRTTAEKTLRMYTHRERERLRESEWEWEWERERKIHSPNDFTYWNWSRLQPGWSFIWVSHVDSRDSHTWAISHSVARHISRKLDGKQSKTSNSIPLQNADIASKSLAYAGTTLTPVKTFLIDFFLQKYSGPSVLQQISRMSDM